VATLTAVLDTLIPADDDPGATQAGVLQYVAGLLVSDASGLLTRYRAGLDAIEAEAEACFGHGFWTLTAEQQHALLQAMERSETRSVWAVDPAAFLDVVLWHAMEGFYGDPQNGGNLDAVSWRMLGFEVTG
jgi:hypothetical protein